MNKIKEFFSFGVFIVGSILCFAVFADQFVNNGRGLDKVLKEHDKRERKVLMKNIEKMYAELNVNLSKEFSHE